MISKSYARFCCWKNYRISNTGEDFDTVKIGEYADIYFILFIIDFSFFILIFISDLCDASSPERRT
jgi:hypothetical protein